MVSSFLIILYYIASRTYKFFKKKLHKQLLFDSLSNFFCFGQHCTPPYRASYFWPFTQIFLQGYSLFFPILFTSIAFENLLLLPSRVRIILNQTGSRSWASFKILKLSSVSQPSIREMSS